MQFVDVVGSGPAGGAAALSALLASRQIRIFEKSAFPRHKVCGEFLSPEAYHVLARIGCGEAFLSLQPSRIRRMVLHFASRSIGRALPEAAFGLSRYALDAMLLRQAVSLGAEVIRETWAPGSRKPGDGPLVVATGRKAVAPPGDRLFGFKAHFEGPVDDAVDLFFFDGSYVGVSSVENNITNVCGLASERLLRQYGFHHDDFLRRFPPLAERLAPLRRTMGWLTTGPLVFAMTRPERSVEEGVYRAGDAFGFIDPFTGSGILNGLITGYVAGRAAARGATSDACYRECRRVLRRPFLVSSVFRAALKSGYADRLASIIPGRLLFQATRPAWKSALQ